MSSHWNIVVVSTFSIFMTKGLVAKSLGSSQEIVDYLINFGYLPQSEIGALIKDTQVKDAVKNLQYFANLQPTGQLDERTQDLLTKPRCGVPDVSHPGFRNKRRVKRYNVQGQRWSRTNLTWTLKVGPSSFKPNQPKLSDISVRHELSRALEMWSRETQLRFREVSPAEDADLKIYFLKNFHGDGYPFDGRGYVLAHAFFPGGGRGGDVHFDDDENWSEGDEINREVSSIFAVAVHEFGHSLGLSHSSVEGSIMFPWYSGMNSARRLPDDDRMGIQHLYGKSAFQFDPNPPSYGNGNVYSENEEDQEKTEGEKKDDEQTPSIPGKCDGNFDAMAVIRSETWAFKGRFFWRINKHGYLGNEPVELNSFWYGLPDDITEIDAVYERPDHKIAFFVGNRSYILKGNAYLEKGPISLTDLGLPPSISKIDAVMRWSWNSKTYFFSDTMYWRFDEDLQQVELDYPRDISIWQGVPYNLDAAFQHSDKQTYFFKGENYWLFDDMKMKTQNGYPKKIRNRWLNCQELKQQSRENNSLSNESVTSNGILKLPNLVLTVISLRTLIFIY